MIVMTKVFDEWARILAENDLVGGATMESLRDGCEFRVVSLSDEKTKVVRSVFVDHFQCEKWSKLTDRERLRECLQVLYYAAISNVDFDVSTRRLPT